MPHHTRTGRLAPVLSRIAGGLLCVAMLAGTPVPASAATATGCAAQGHYEVCLTDPSTAAGDTDRTIIERLRQLVQSTHDGDSIRIAMYTWTFQDVADDIVAAHDRGVDVRAVVDTKVADVPDPDSPYRKLTGAGIPVRVCTNSCLASDGHLMHNKFFLFRIGGVPSVVQTSSNLTSSQVKAYNNLIRITGDARLYDFYQDYWNRLEARSWTYDGDTWTDGDRHRIGSLDTKGYVFPRSSDTVLGILDNVTACSSDGDGDSDGDRKIWVAAAFFTSGRERVRNRLAQLEDRLGCNVEVIVRDRATEDWVQGDTSGGYNLANDHVRDLHDDARDIHMHNKIIILDAKYNGEWQETVFTGSHNLSGGSLHDDDEAMVRVTDAFVFDRYRHYYDTLFAEALG